MPLFHLKLNSGKRLRALTLTNGYCSLTSYILTLIHPIHLEDSGPMPVQSCVLAPLLLNFYINTLVKTLQSRAHSHLLMLVEQSLWMHCFHHTTKSALGGSYRVSPNIADKIYINYLPKDTINGLCSPKSSNWHNWLTDRHLDRTSCFKYLEAEKPTQKCNVLSIYIISFRSCPNDSYEFSNCPRFFPLTRR